MNPSPPPAVADRPKRTRAALTLGTLAAVGGVGSLVSSLLLWLSTMGSQCTWAGARAACSPFVPVLYLLPYALTAAAVLLAVLALSRRDEAASDRCAGGAWIVWGAGGLVWCALMAFPASWFGV